MSWKLKIHLQCILKKSWNFSTAYHESRTRSSDNSILIGRLQLFGYGGLSVYVLVSNENNFTFFLCMCWICALILLCLPSSHHGKQCILSWKSDGILLSDFCGNPVLCNGYVCVWCVWRACLLSLHSLSRWQHCTVQLLSVQILG